MTPVLAFVLPYYRNPRMLAEQYRVWAAYPADAKAALEVVLVDDGSPEHARDVPRPEGLPALRIYRVLQDIPWHQHGARNLGAQEATAPWLLLTDMDHVVPTATLVAVLAKLPAADAQRAYTFGRVDAPHLRPTRDGHGRLKPHVNSFLMPKAWFWRIGGYDEDCVGYGTDSYFRARLKAAGPVEHLAHLPLVRYPREVIPDASSFAPGLDPRAFRNAGRRGNETRRRLARKAKQHLGPTVLAFPWERTV